MRGNLCIDIDTSTTTYATVVRNDQDPFIMIKLDMFRQELDLFWAEFMSLYEISFIFLVLAALLIFIPWREIINLLYWLL